MSFKPWRTTAWSSAIKILMPTRFALSRWRLRDAHGDGGALARLAMHAHFAPQQGSAFAHPEQADGTGVVYFRLGDPPSVVFHFQDQIARSFCQVDVHAGGV